MDEEEEWVEYDGGVVQEWHQNATRIRAASDVAVIPENAFEESDHLMEVDLNNVTTISGEAFQGCYYLERVIWSAASAVEIGNYAFGECISLEEINIGNVTKIGARAFSGCWMLERVSIPSSVATIGDFTFRGCERVVEVEIGEGLQRIEKGAFHSCGALGRINIPSSVTAIEDESFWECHSMEEVELNEGLQHIGESAFQHCTSLVTIDIPSTAWKVGDRAFCDCSELSEVILREGIHDIGAGAFNDCTSLEHITIPRVAFVIDVWGRSYQLLRGGTMPAQSRVVVVSKWLQFMSQGQLEQAEAKLNEILGRRQPVRQKIESIQRWFAYHDVTTMLELAIWRVNMDDNGRDADVRQRSRRNCGSDMNVIIPGVLEYLGLLGGHVLGG